MFRVYESNGAYGLGFGFKTTPIGRGDIARAYRNKRLKELQGEHRARALKCVGMDTKIFSSEMAQIFMDKYLTVLEKGAQDAKSDGVKDLLSNMIRACKTAKLKTTATGSGYHIVFPLGTEMKIMAKEHLLIEASGGEKEHRGALLLNLNPETIRENQLIWSKETFDLYLYTGKAEAAKVRATKRLKTASTAPILRVVAKRLIPLLLELGFEELKALTMREDESGANVVLNGSYQGNEVNMLVSLTVGEDGMV
jgi:hypothetical protein